MRSRQPRSITERLAYRIQVWLYRAFSPMQPGLPSIDSDPQKALDHAYWGLRRKKFDPPDLPPEYEGSPDLGSLAVRGPYSIYLTKVTDGEYEWNFKNLEGYGHHQGLYNLGVRVLFRVDSHSRRLREYEIETPDLGKSQPGDPTGSSPKGSHSAPLPTTCRWCATLTGFTWPAALNWRSPHEILFLGMSRFAACSGPIYFRTQQSNDVVTRGQMVRGGDFETIFSFRHDGMCRLFEDTYQQFDFLVNDPVKDAERRGVRGEQTWVSRPQRKKNLEDLFDVFQGHAERYLLIYYRSDGTIQRRRVLKFAGTGESSAKPRPACGAMAQGAQSAYSQRHSRQTR